MHTTIPVHSIDLSARCMISWFVVWFIGFTLLLCWSILQIPDGGGKASWVPEVFFRKTMLAVCLMSTCSISSVPTRKFACHSTDKGYHHWTQPFCPVVFALPSIFWPITLCVVMLRCGLPLSPRRILAERWSGRLKHEKGEVYRLLPDVEDNWTSAGLEDGIPLGDLGSDSSRSSYDTTTTSTTDRSSQDGDDDDAARDVGVTNFANLFRAVSYGPVSTA